MSEPRGVYQCRACRRTLDGSELRRDPDVAGTRWICRDCLAGVEKISNRGKDVLAWGQFAPGVLAVAVGVALFLPVVFEGSLPFALRALVAVLVGGMILGGVVIVQEFYRHFH